MSTLTTREAMLRGIVYSAIAANSTLPAARLGEIADFCYKAWVANLVEPLTEVYDFAKHTLAEAAGDADKARRILTQMRDEGLSRSAWALVATTPYLHEVFLIAEPDTILDHLADLVIALGPED